MRFAVKNPYKSKLAGSTTLLTVDIARDVVKKIEDNLVYPGLIKVTVIRETRSVEYAR